MNPTTDISQVFADATDEAFSLPLLGTFDVRQVEAGEEWQAIFDSVHRETLGGIPLMTGVWSEAEVERFRALRAPLGSSPCAHRLVFERGDEVVGCYVGAQSQSDHYHMQFTGIRAAWRGRGLYSAFLQRLLECLRAVGFRQAFSRHLPDNSAVLAPKLRAGFMIQGIEISPIWGTLVRLVHPLTPGHRDAYRRRIGSLQAAPVEDAAEQLRVDDDVVLHPIQLSDAHALHALIDRNRDHLRAWLPWVDDVRGIPDVQAFATASQESARLGRGQVFVIRRGGAVAGVLGVDDISPKNRNCTIGFWLGAEFVGHAIMTRACRRVLRHLFDDRGINRVEIGVAIENTRSRAVPERLGLTFEGVRRGIELLDGRFLDHAIYSATAGDWTGTTSI